MTDFPQTRGALTPGRALSDLTWLRVGGPAVALFQPADKDDLVAFLRGYEEAVFTMGVGSNLIVRDGGLEAVVIRLGRGFNGIEVDGSRVRVGAAALDAHVARRAAEAGRDLTFLRTIPAGCYGSYMADVFVEAEVVTRTGETVTLGPDDLNFRYRQSDLPEGCVITQVVLDAPPGEPEQLAARMEDQLAKRDATQPTKERTAGSTFRNPAGYSSTGRADDSQELKAWKLIEEAGLRGHTLGGAQMSPKHPNFLVNTGTASAADLEDLGELVRKKVSESCGITLEWEVLRLGNR